MQFVFDSGFLFYVPKPPQEATPIYFGSLKTVTLTFDILVKTESLQLAVKTTPMFSEMIITGNAKNAMIKSRALGPLFFNRNLSQGSTMMRDLTEPALTITSGTISLVLPSGGTFSKDMGVYDAVSGAQFKFIVGVPAAGQYAQNLGTYTFNVADEGKKVLVAYLYTVPTGYNFDLNNFFKGVMPTFEMVLMNKEKGKQRIVQLSSCASKKLILPPQMEKYEVDDFSFQCFSDKTVNIDGLVANFSTAE